MPNSWLIVRHLEKDVTFTFVLWYMSHLSGHLSWPAVSLCLIHMA